MEIVGDPSRIKEGNERLPLPEPTRQPGNGGPTPIGSGNQTTDPPAVPPTNTAGRPTPAIRVPEGPRPILDGRRLVADDDLRPRPAPVGRARPHSDDPDRRAAERLAALKFAEARERTIVGTLNPAFGLDPLGNPVQPVKPGTDRKPPAELDPAEQVVGDGVDLDAADENRGPGGVPRVDPDLDRVGGGVGGEAEDPLLGEGGGRVGEGRRQRSRGFDRLPSSYCRRAGRSGSGM